MALIQLRDVRIAFSGPPLLDRANLTIDPGERVSLVGRNGEGKSTLLAMLSGRLEPDDGEIIRRPGLRVSVLPQDVPADLHGSIYTVASTGLDNLGQLIADYHDVSHRLAEASPDAKERKTLENELDRIGKQLEEEDGWRLQSRVESTLTELDLDPDAEVSTLSAGMKRRVLLARALVSDPELLLLDEPTNHLDIEAIDRMEAFFEKFRGTLVFVTHDRVFLRKLSTRILDLDRGVLRSYACDYDLYRKRKEGDLEAEAEQNAQFDRKLAEEEVWIRKGVRERRTRNEGRVRALKQLRVERRERRERIGSAKLQIQEAEKSGRLVIAADGLTFSYGDQPIVRDFSHVVARGDKIGVIGPNGVGKTTLLRLLLGERKPDSGEIRHGTRLQVAYFDQIHAQLDLESSVVENLADGSDHVMINGVKKHIYGYLEDFLFSSARARSPVKFLSGGERNRLLLARLFSKPANVLVLDEPTNDLDAETLELLEQLLVDYAGTVLMVSHDREFLNNVVTDTLVFEGDGAVKAYAGGYDDWLAAASRQASEAPAAPEATPLKQAKPKSRPKPSNGQRLTYGEQLELQKLPERIEELEGQVAALHEQMSDPAFYEQDHRAIAEVNDRLAAVEADLATVYERWESLESRAE